MPYATSSLLHRQGQPADVLIVGAGPVGLTLACFLARSGITFEIIDVRGGPVIESRALGIHARTLEFMRMLELDGEFVGRGRRTDTMIFHDVRRKLFSLDFGVLRQETPYPYYLILPQSDTEDILVGWLARRGHDIQWRHRLAELHVDEGGPVAMIEVPDGHLVSRRYRYVVGADGASSRVRECSGIAFEGATYPAEFLLAEAKIEEHAIETNATHVFIARNTTAAVIPMPNGEYRIVGPNFARDASGASGHPVDFADFLGFLKRADLFAGISFKDPSRVVSYRMHKRVASAFRRGPVFLVGDAAHIHSPAGGQGMNTGIHDAVNLAWKLAAVLHGRADDVLLDSYELERRTMAKRVVVGTDKAMGLATSRSPLVRFGLFWLAPLGARLGQPKQLLRNMAQLSIDYGPGEGRTTGGAFRAGVRLPWFPIAHGLSSLDLVGPSDFLLIIAAAGHEELRAVNERRHALWHLPGIGGDGIQTVVLANNRFYRGGVSRSESRVRVLPDTEGALHRLRANGAEAVLVRPDGYVLAADSTSRLAAIRDALLHVARPQRAAA